MTKESKEYDTEEAAEGLFQLFVENSFGIKHEGVRVTEEGLKKMSLHFSEVPIEERGWVFISFLSRLYESEYSYDILQFIDMEQVDD